MSDPAGVPPTKPAHDGLRAALQPLGRHTGVASVPAVIAPAATERPARVLVADDHLVPRRELSELLDAQADLRLIAAVSCAEEALVTAERERIDAAVVDYKLGDHDGLWVSGELKRPSRPPRVVLRCDYPNGLLAAAAVIAEADALVSTAAAGAELCQAIRSTLDGRPILPTIPRGGRHDAPGIRRRGAGSARDDARRIPRSRIASALRVSSAGLDLRQCGMLHKLGAGR